jgi:hypothetical protein
MHYPEGSTSLAIWAGIKAWVAVLDGLTFPLTAGEVRKMADITSIAFVGSTYLTGRNVGDILYCTKKVLTAAMSFPEA